MGRANILQFFSFVKQPKFHKSTSVIKFEVGQAELKQQRGRQEESRLLLALYVSMHFELHLKSICWRKNAKWTEVWVPDVRASKLMTKWWRSREFVAFPANTCVLKYTAWLLFNIAECFVLTSVCLSGWLANWDFFLRAGTLVRL